MRTFGSLLTILFVLSPAFSQNQPPEPQDGRAILEGFLIQGGVVNMIEGEAAYMPPDAPPQAISAKQQLKNGDTIQTGHNGRAEILLNPGYYLRMSANTRIVFLDFAPGNLALKITSGSAIIEIVTIETLYTYFWDGPDPAFSIFYDSISVSFPQNQFSTVTGGIYRIDIGPDQEAQLTVAKGRAFFAGHRVEKGMSASFRNGSTTVTKFKTDQTDAFDVWSRARAELLVKTNQSLKKTHPFRTLRRNDLSYLNIEFDEEDEQLIGARTVSALSGLVNFIQPGVFVLRKDEEQWSTLEPRAELKYGDRVRTDADGRAQISLYGTCSLFLETNTEIIYRVRPDGDVAVKVLRGSALVLFGYGDKEKAARPVISFATPQIEYEILRDGIYQLTVGSNESEMNVYYGRVRVAGREIKEDKKAVFRNSQLEIRELSKKSRDSLYVWSLKRTSALTRSRRVRLNGVWYFHSAANVHTYVPGARMFRSPYGGEYQVQLMRRSRSRFP